MSDAGDLLLNMILSVLATFAGTLGVPLALLAAAWIALKLIARRFSRRSRRRSSRSRRARRSARRASAPRQRQAIRPGCDPRRAFTPAERQALFAYCGYRCEHVGDLGLRCGAPAEHADHIVPWSKGGPTRLENGQGLCEMHNLAKGARMPTQAEVDRLRRLRSRYALAA